MQPASPKRYGVSWGTDTGAEGTSARALEEQKRRAIAHHSDAAAGFVARYERLAVDPYGSCFGYSRYRLQAILDLCLPEDGRGLRALDVGCGTGHHLADLRRRGFEVAGVDGSPEMVARARVHNQGVPIECADVEALPFPAGRFDVVLCIEVLRYLRDPAGCLRELARVLRPGGVCLVTATPLLNLNGYWLVNRVASGVGLPGLTRLRQFFHTSRQLRQKFKAAGFGPTRVHGVYLGPVNWVERFAPRLVPGILRKWEWLDTALADRPVLRELSNMFLVRAVREATRD